MSGKTNLEPFVLVGLMGITLAAGVFAFYEHRASQPLPPLPSSIGPTPAVPPGAGDAPDVPVSDVVGVAPLPAGSVPARGRPVTWITNEDYPAEALRNNWQGAVRIRWTIDVAGRAVNCQVLESSGHEVLDRTACDLIENRAAYEPARDPQGNAIPSEDMRRVVWKLPD